MPLWADDDAALDIAAGILGQGKSSRLYQRLVYKEQSAQNVSAFQFSRELAGMVQISATAREGFNLTQMETAIMEEVARLAKEGPTADEMAMAKNVNEANPVSAPAPCSVRRPHQQLHDIPRQARTCSTRIWSACAR